MELIPKQQVDIDIANIEASGDTFINAVNAAIFSLNNSHQALWSLSDDRLTAVLQKMHDDNTLNSVFFQHNSAAAAVNTILGTDAAKIVAPKQIVITDGILSFAEEEKETQLILNKLNS